MTTPVSGLFDLARLREACANCGVHQLCLPAGMCEETLNRITRIVRDKRPLAAGAALFHAGTRCDALYVVRSGSLMSVLPLENGDTQVVGFHLPGEFCGLDGIGSHIHGCTVVALERSRICEMPMLSLQDVAAKVPAVREALERVVGRELMDSHLHLALMGKHLAPERLAAFIVSLSRRYQRLHRDPLQLKLTMARQDIASYLGLAVETVSRLFTRFEEQGFVDVRRRQVRILNLEALAAICNGAVGEPAPEQERQAS